MPFDPNNPQMSEGLTYDPTRQQVQQGADPRNRTYFDPEDPVWAQFQNDPKYAGVDFRDYMYSPIQAASSDAQPYETYPGSNEWITPQDVGGPGKYALSLTPEAIARREAEAKKKKMQTIAAGALLVGGTMALTGGFSGGTAAGAAESGAAGTAEIAPWVTEGASLAGPGASGGAGYGLSTTATTGIQFGEAAAATGWGTAGTVAEVAAGTTAAGVSGGTSTTPAAAGPATSAPATQAPTSGAPTTGGPGPVGSETGIDWGTWIPRIVEGVGGVIGSEQYQDNIDAGVDAQLRANENSLEFLRESRDLEIERNRPMIEARDNAMTQMQNMAGIGEEEFDITADPSYQWRMDQGIRALDASAAAGSGMGSGGYSKDLMEYAQGMASTEYSNIFNRLSGIAGTAQTGNSSAAYNQSIAGIMQDQGLATASGYAAKANNSADMYSSVFDQAASLPWSEWLS